MPPASTGCVTRCKPLCLTSATAALQQEIEALALADAIRAVAIHLAKFGEVMAWKDRFAVVRAWHDAVNRGDADALVALCDDDI